MSHITIFMSVKKLPLMRWEAYKLTKLQKWWYKLMPEQKQNKQKRKGKGKERKGKERKEKGKEKKRKEKKRKGKKRKEKKRKETPKKECGHLHHTICKFLYFSYFSKGEWTGLHTIIDNHCQP